MLADIIFYSTLTVSITMGSYYKEINDLETKKNYGTGLGILIACFICGAGVVHTMLMVWGNIVIIKCSDRRYVHQISLGWTWLYLLYMHIRLVNAVYVVWLNQNIALRLVGMAFEMHGAVTQTTNRPSTSATSTGVNDRDVFNPSALDISQIIMLLSTSVCTEAGFGVYPAEYLPLPGLGPSVRHNLLKKTPNIALTQEYNFSMLKCFEHDRLLIGPRMKDTLKSWDMSTRYWFWAHIYKNLLNADKYMKLPWDIGFSMMRMFCLIYLTPCFIVSDAAIVFKYYNSIFWVYHALLLIMIIGAAEL
ncbi:putative leukocyte receptor cluster lrc 4 [Operophtera brumata]|uniref:Putative leukocyte receptor cluster lrc 4 n=1 Tax=Operophtera brumata TaxID=104452 RepID=A0A0L7LAK3_OPEBR|nr:putative leukocyte receptor cluster lrc 4 [Operophtera brumata]